MKVLFSCILLFILIVTISCLPSCTKDTTTTIIKTDTVTIRKTDTVNIRITDTLRTVFTDSSTMGLLTRKQWIIDSAISNYSGPGTGTLLYARGSNNNIYNYDLVRSIFWIGGNEDGFNSIGAHYSYSWKLTNSDSTALLISSGGSPVYHAKILKLDATHLTFFDSTDNVLDINIYKP